MKAQLSLQEIKEHATDVLNRCDSPTKSVEALLALATRVAGSDPYPELGAVDLDSDITRIAEQVRYVLRERPPPAEVRYLLVGAGTFRESTTARPTYAGCLSGQAELDPDDLDAVMDPVYSACEFQIQSAFLDGVVQQDYDDEDVGELALSAVLAPATGVLFRAAVEQLGLPYTVVIASDDFDPYPYVLKRTPRD